MNDASLSYRQFGNRTSLFKAGNMSTLEEFMRTLLATILLATQEDKATRAVARSARQRIVSSYTCGGTDGTVAPTTTDYVRDFMLSMRCRARREAVGGASDSTEATAREEQSTERK